MSNAAPKFKDYDKLYRHCEGIIHAHEGIDDKARQTVRAIKAWKYADQIESWAQPTIQLAVYDSETSEQWQRFRVSLKGNDTRLKLLRLERRYAQTVLNNNLPVEERALEHCRIDNYIGALVRGGQLKPKTYEVNR